jgi:hypothetical protein
MDISPQSIDFTLPARRVGQGPNLRLIVDLAGGTINP